MIVMFNDTPGSLGHSLGSNFSSTGNSTVFRILLQLSFLKSKHLRCKINTTGSSSNVTCCHAATSWFVRLHVTPSSWSRPTRISNASRTDDAFCEWKKKVLVPLPLTKVQRSLPQ